jgi:hypothetical protein
MVPNKCWGTGAIASAFSLERTTVSSTRAAEVCADVLAAKNEGKIRRKKRGVKRFIKQTPIGLMEAD